MNRRLSYSNVMSTLAFVLLLAGGTALAAGLPKASVTSKTVKDGSLTGADVRDGSLSGADVADGAVSGAKLTDGSLTGADLADGSVGATKLTGGSVSGAAIGNAAVGSANLTPDVAGSASVLNNNLRDRDFKENTLTDVNIDESTLTGIADASHLGGRDASGFVSVDVYKAETPRMPGTAIGGGAREIREQCENPQDVLLSGGPTTNDPVTETLESERVGNEWVVVIRDELPTTLNEWAVRVLCARAFAP